MTAPGRRLRRVRVIPTLLIDGEGRLVKTVKFAKRTYIGDPINAVQIFNRKEVDELVLMDIDASKSGRDPDYALIEAIVSEAFMPVAYGGGVTSMAHIEALYGCGIEKVILSSCLAQGTSLVSEAAARFGAQAVVACLPIKSSMFGKTSVRLVSGKKDTGSDAAAMATALADAGAGELILYSIDRDGTWSGYDLDGLRRVANAVDVPVVACGGAGSLDDFRRAVTEAGCSAVAAGSLFVYQSRGRGVLITYPKPEVLREKLYEPITLG
ncbi:MAG: AglZ/HisF2 family acetamidino modification protein [Pseudomonadota bacterium]